MAACLFVSLIKNERACGRDSGLRTSPVYEKQVTVRIIRKEEGSGCPIVKRTAKDKGCCSYHQQGQNVFILFLLFILLVMSSCNAA